MNILDDKDLLNLAREMTVALVKSNPNLEENRLMVAELKRRSRFTDEKSDRLLATKFLTVGSLSFMWL
ncbi:hypothetical protein [Microseira wollei]|uniref:Uncharacterized protein n=1 Tax=Microseira wollei NIES-4236 TaxID=2530354 RepID=A0AAV3XPC4_9CYAN|nr:hypothetical protein [Microseira wollei]GET43566.1 hypothetical protein MiSe_83910 [Microseira wollei NIES-4236]